MESRNNNRDFEQFLKQNADQYRMFPSENVWRGIDNALHTRRRWYGLGLALLLLLTGGGVTWVMLTTPSVKDQPVTATKTASSEKIKALEQPAPAIPQAAIKTPTITGPQIYSYPASSPTIETITSSYVAGTTVPNSFTEANLQSAPDMIASHETHFINQLPHASAPKLLFDVNNALLLPLATIQVVDAPIKAETENTHTENNVQAADKEKVTDIYPLTIESVVNSFKRNRPAKAFAFQYYIAPTISYRKLSENKAFLRSAASSGTVPASVAYRDVNNAVTHKPDIGLEIGAAAKYPLTKALHLKAGLQFNISRYDIRAFNNPGEIATIALDAGAGTNSISRETIYRNYNGSRTNWLQNLYFTASIPVGAELRFPSRKATYFAIAGTVQPTYIISDRAYLLSTDYKNYVEVPSLIRRWNFNTGFEALVGYSSGNMQWQIGPQVRYQMRSSFQDQYPLKENLFDFGLKVGVMFNR